MADFSRQSDDLPPPHRPPSPSMNSDPTTENGGSHLPNNGAAATSATASSVPEVSKEVQDVLGSDVRALRLFPPRLQVRPLTDLRRLVSRQC